MAVPIEQLVEHYLKVKSHQETAKHFGLHVTTVSRHLRAAGVKTFRGNQQPNRKWRVSSVDPAPILLAFGRLHNQRAVAKELGIHQTVVSRCLIRCGIRIGTGQTTRYPIPDEKVRALYESGLSTAQVGQQVGLDAESVRRRLRSLGVPRRAIGGTTLSGENNGQWKGGFHHPLHYYRRQSYEIAAICFGQPLPRGWAIHHLDENPENNNPENLWVFPDVGSHARFHQQLLRLLRQGGQVDPIQILQENGAVPLPRPPAPIEFAPGTDQPALSGKELLAHLARRSSLNRQGLHLRRPNPVPDGPL